MQPIQLLLTSYALVAIFTFLTWFGKGYEYVVAAIIFGHQARLIHRVRKGRMPILGAIDGPILGLTLLYHAVITAIDAYSLVGLFYGTAELFGIRTWRWIASLYAPIICQTIVGIAECAVLYNIITLPRVESAVHAEVHPPTSSLVTNEKY
jgi:hypothetical protein